MTIIPAAELPLWAYHAAPAISASKLAVFRKRPLLFKRTYIDQAVTKKRTKALDEGGGFDCSLFDGDEVFAANYICKPEAYINADGESKPWSGNSNTCKAWMREQEDAGRTILDPDAMVRFRAMREAIRGSEFASALLAQGEAQISIRRHSQEFDLDLQVRPDWLSMKPIDRPDLGLQSHGRPYIVDVKTTEDFNDWFDATDPDDTRRGSPVHKWGYHFQGGMCQWVAFQDIGETAHFLLVVEKREPFAVGVMIMSGEYLNVGWERCRIDLHNLKRCMATNVWPNSPAHPVVISPPSFLLDKATRETVHAAGAMP